MNILKISKRAWNTPCPKCKKYIGLATHSAIKDGDFVRCKFCDEPYKIELLEDSEGMF